MAKTLIIVESPTKTKTFKKVLGSDFSIKASKGHVVDLPKSKLGIDLEDDFQPQYVTIKGKGAVLKELKAAAARSDRILLATDPDREGEAIAWHLSRHLESIQPKIERILLNEITRDSVEAAVANPGKLDSDKVDAQQARRVLDRLVGYQVSPVLWRVFYTGLSAGRVQSVALRLIVEREAERRAFEAVEYWSLIAHLRHAKDDEFEAKLHRWQDEKPEIGDQAAMEAILAALKGKPWEILEVEKKPRKRAPSPPYITSTLQQDASRRLRYSARRTMAIAQQLYEGLDIGEEGPVGLITYMRTDSTRIADSARNEHRDFVLSEYGDDYMPDKPRSFKARKSAQDAHEAIRPTRVSLTPSQAASFLDKNQLALYSLIWRRFVASLMADARFEATRADITCGPGIFRATGQRLVFDGYRRALGDLIDDNDKLLPELADGDKLDLVKLDPQQHFTEPPPRYSESSLIRALEEKGIGRPSTYATIVSTIQSRDYLDRDDNRRFFPTELGENVWKVLAEGFPKIFEIDFTARMEAELDRIEEDGEQWTDVVRELYDPLHAALEAVTDKQDELRLSVREETEIDCDRCGKPMIKTWGRNGRFLSCSAYPDCKGTRPLEDPQPAGEQTCPLCGTQMQIRVGRYGRFAACGSYPDCKGTAPLQIGVSCPREDCQGEIVEKKSKRGRIFFGCNSYPDCDFASWNRPVKDACPDCGGMVVEKSSKAKGNFQQCSVCKLEIPY